MMGRSFRCLLVLQILVSNVNAALLESKSSEFHQSMFSGPCRTRSSGCGGREFRSRGLKDIVTISDYFKSIKSRRATNEVLPAAGLDEKLCPVGIQDSFFRFIPEHRATLLVDSSHWASSWSTPCFHNVTGTVSALASGELRVIVVTSGNTGLRACEERYLLATTFRFEVVTFSGAGSVSVDFPAPDPAQLVELKTAGIHIFRFCDSSLKTIWEAWDTLRLFFGGFGTGSKGHVTADMVRSNIQFIQDHMKYKLKERKQRVVRIDPSHIQSGDFFAILRLDGLDPLIMFGSGSRVGHTAVALRVEGQLYVLESQDGWYWPQPHGLIMTPFEEWIQWAEDADFHVAVLPLAPEVRARFNETAAYHWFKSVEGLPYGYHNMIFTWLDTESNNLPEMASYEAMAVLFSLIDHLAPPVADRMWNQALNKRLGTKGLRTFELYREAAKKGMSFGQLAAVPERDYWEYNDGYSMVCSTLVLNTYKAAGIFGTLGESIHGTEFHPRDVYSLKIFDPSYQKPSECSVDALPYCQLLGTYLLELPEFNSLEPYAHMAETCPSLAPDYFRPRGC